MGAGPVRPALATTGRAVLVATGFATAGVVTSLPLVALAFALGGVGAGSVYTVAVNTPVKWFDERRGLATGAIAMTYSGGSFLVIPLVRSNVEPSFTDTLLVLGAIAGLGIAVAVPFLRDPPSASAAGGQPDQRERSAADDGSDTPKAAYTWRETVRTWQFWVLYAVMVVVNGVGLMLIGKVVTFADQLGLAAVVATGSASVIALADAGGALVGGGASDRFGNERTVAASLLCCGGAVALAVWAGNAGFGVAFVAFVAAAGFFRSPIFAIAPGLVGRYYGRAHSSENYAALYTAKVWGGIGDGVVASIAVATIGWSSSFLAGAALLALAGVAMLFVRPVAEARQ